MVKKFGFVTKTESMAIKGQIIDRYGSEGGKYLAPKNTSYEMRGIPKGYTEYHQYEVLRPFKWYEGQTASTPQFGVNGGGWEYMTSTKVKDLVKYGYLKRLK